MSWDDDAVRTIPATPQRRAEARRQGRVPYSDDLSAALMLTGIALLLGWQGPQVVTACAEWLWRSLTSEPVLRADELSMSGFPFGPLLMSVMGLLSAMWIMAIVVHWLPLGPLWSPETIRPRTERINPLQGLRKRCSGFAAVGGMMWLLRLAAMGGLIVWTLHGEAAILADLHARSPGRLAETVSEVTVSFVLRLGGVLLALGVIDFLWQRWQVESDLRMTDYERRSEQREHQRQAPMAWPSSHRDVVRANALRGIERV